MSLRHVLVFTSVVVSALSFADRAEALTCPGDPICATANVDLGAILGRTTAKLDASAAVGLGTDAGLQVCVLLDTGIYRLLVVGDAGANLVADVNHACPGGTGQNDALDAGSPNVIVVDTTGEVLDTQVDASVVVSTGGQGGSAGQAGAGGAGNVDIDVTIGGRGGSAGSAGQAGAGGNTGTGGTNNDGSSGSAGSTGNAGNAGNAGAGGNAGSAGNAGAGGGTAVGRVDLDLETFGDVRIGIPRVDGADRHGNPGTAGTTGFGSGGRIGGGGTEADGTDPVESDGTYLAGGGCSVALPHADEGWGAFALAGVAAVGAAVRSKKRR